MSVDMISIGISFERMLHNTEKILLLNTSNQNNTHSYPFLARSYKHTNCHYYAFCFLLNKTKPYPIGTWKIFSMAPWQVAIITLDIFCCVVATTERVQVSADEIFLKKNNILSFRGRRRCNIYILIVVRLMEMASSFCRHTP